MQFCAELGITKTERDWGEEEGLGEDKLPLKVSLPGDRARAGWGRARPRGLAPFWPVLLLCASTDALWVARNQHF